MPPGARAFLPMPLRNRRMSAWKRMMTISTKLLTMNIQEPFQGKKLQLPGHQIGDKQEEEPGQDLDGLGAAQDQDHLVNDDGDQDDVNTILPAQIA